jgi:hypothetical protein
MRGFALELLVYALVFLGIVVFNYLIQRLARRARQRLPAPEPRPVETEQPLETGWGRASRAAALPEEVLAARRAPPPRAAAAPPQPRPPAHRLFGSREELRRAIVAMTVLGPCRAEDPPRRR